MHDPTTPPSYRDSARLPSISGNGTVNSMMGHGDPNVNPQNYYSQPNYNQPPAAHYNANFNQPPSAAQVMALQNFGGGNKGCCGCENPCCLGYSAGVWVRMVFAVFVWLLLLTAASSEPLELCKLGDQECSCRFEDYQCKIGGQENTYKYDDCSGAEFNGENIFDLDCGDIKDSSSAFYGGVVLAWLACNVVIIWDLAKNCACLNIRSGCGQYSCLYIGTIFTSFTALIAYFNWHSSDCCDKLRVEYESDELQIPLRAAISAWFWGMIWFVLSIWQLEHKMFGKPEDWGQDRRVQQNGVQMQPMQNQGFQP